MLKEETELTPDQQDFHVSLRKMSPALSQVPALLQEFRELLCKRVLNGYEKWREKVAQSELIESQNLRADFGKMTQPVCAGFSSEWSNAQVEGPVNKVKLVKRPMYGRGNFPLL